MGYSNVDEEREEEEVGVGHEHFSTGRGRQWRIQSEAGYQSRDRDGPDDMACHSYAHQQFIIDADNW